MYSVVAKEKWHHLHLDYCKGCFHTAIHAATGLIYGTKEAH